MLSLLSAAMLPLPLRQFAIVLMCVAPALQPAWAAAQSAPAPATELQERLKRVGADLFSPRPNPARAIDELKSILAVDPDLAEAHMLLGIAYRAQGSPELLSEAVAELRQAISLKPSLALARLTLARVYLDMARASRAREELEIALEELPGRPEVLSLLGEAERQTGNAKRSVELNREALKADPGFVQARYYLGLALLDLGQHAGAIRELEAVAASGANPAEAYLGLGTAYLEAKRIDDAIGALAKAAQADPKADTRIRLARAYRLKGRLNDALQQLQLARPSATEGLSALYQSVESDLYMEEGLIRLQQGRLEAAAEAFQKVLGLNADHEAAKRQLAEVQKRLKDARKKPGESS
ncbi:MAG TPA: tetratricopeptide repeat protein [Vicinamibacterales bacterium]|nr:tetratricopeptide repeat protein [Vicinamibacterales bacterium]